MAMMYCPGCGIQQSSDQVYCAHDGTRLVKSEKVQDVEAGVSKHCRDCGTGLDKTSHYCPTCGTVTSHVKLKASQRNRSTEAVASMLKGKNTSHGGLTASIRKEDLLASAVSGLKIAAVPFLLFWLVAWYAAGRIQGTEAMIELSEEIGRSAVSGLFGAGDLFLMIQGVNADYSFSMLDESGGLSLSAGFFPVTFLLILTLVLSVWLVKRFDPSMASVHIPLVAGFTGLLYVLGLTVVSFMVSGEMNVTDSLGDVTAVTQSYSPSAVTVLQGMVIAVVTGLTLLVQTYKRSLFEVADGWFRYGGVIMAGLLTGFVAYLFSILFNTLRITASSGTPNGFDGMPGEVGTVFLSNFLYVQSNSMSMFQTALLKVSASDLGSQIGFPTAEFRSWIFGSDSVMDLYAQGLSTTMPMRQWVLSPELWTVLVPLIVFIAGGWLISRHIGSVDWKQLLSAAVATATMTWLIGVANRVTVEFEGEGTTFGGAVSASLHLGIAWIPSFIAVTLISFVIYYAVSWFKH